MSRLRVLLVNGNYEDGTVGGTQTFTRDLAERLTAAGHAVGVLCHGEHEAREVRDGVIVYRVRCPRVRLAERSRPVAWANTALAVHNPLVGPLVGPVVRHFAPDVCHVQMLRRFTFAALPQLGRHGAATVQTVHEMISMWNFNPFRNESPAVAESVPSRLVALCKRRHRVLSRCVDHVCAPSEWALRGFRDTGYFRGVPGTVVPNASSRLWGDPLAVARRRLAALDPAAPTRFLFVGRLEEYKGVKLLLDAVRLLPEAPLRLTVVGDGALAGEVRRHADRDRRITHAGPLFGDELAAAYTSADALVCPSLWRETFGLVVSEAQNAALPCIVTDRGALSERLAGLDAGILLDAHPDAAGLAAALSELCSAERRAAMIPAAAQAAAAFGPDEFLARQVEVYRQAIARRRSRGRVARDARDPRDARDSRDDRDDPVDRATTLTS